MKPRTTIAKLNKESQFINNSTVGDDLTALSLEDLAQRYISIEQQSQLYKGLILLEARERFASDKEFGEWVVTNGLSVGTNQQNRTLFMNLARFFKHRDMTGISLTAAYEISRPQNADIAEEIYAYALLKHLSVSEVKAKIAELKNQAGVALVSDENKKIQVFVLADKLQTYKNSVLGDIKDLPNQEAIRVLKSCLKELQEKKDTPTQETEITETSQAS